MQVLEVTVYLAVGQCALEGRAIAPFDKDGAVPTKLLRELLRDIDRKTVEWAEGQPVEMGLYVETRPAIDSELPWCELVVRGQPKGHALGFCWEDEAKALGLCWGKGGSDGPR